jgi:hypothetical protein
MARIHVTHELFWVDELLRRTDCVTIRGSNLCLFVYPTVSLQGINPRKRALQESIVANLARKSPAFYGTRLLVTAFITYGHRALI